MQKKEVSRQKRKAHIRKVISGTSVVPRLSVYRSNNHIYAQLIDDVSKVTVAAANDVKASGKPVEKATLVGKQIAELAKKKGISEAVFDRNGYKFHGRIKALAEAARESGMKI